MAKNMFNMEGRVVIITGGAGLLGTEYALCLANAGANVVIVDLDADECRKTAATVTAKSKRRAIGIATDISNKSSIKEMVKKAVMEFGKVDVLINNAATKSSNFFLHFEDFPLEDWEKIMSVNLTGAFICSQIVGKQMLKQGFGNIINVSSIYGVVAPDQRIYKGSKYLGKEINTPVIYSVTKGGVIMLTKYLATYWADKKIRVNCITPGGVFSGQNKTFVKNYSKRTPLGRMANKDEMNGAVLFLASDASSYVTGHNLIVDGGWTTW